MSKTKSSTRDSRVLTVLRRLKGGRPVDLDHIAQFRADVAGWLREEHGAPFAGLADQAERITDAETLLKWWNDYVATANAVRERFAQFTTEQLDQLSPEELQKLGIERRQTR